MLLSPMFERVPRTSILVLVMRKGSPVGPLHSSDTKSFTFSIKAFTVYLGQGIATLP